MLAGGEYLLPFMNSLVIILQTNFYSYQFLLA